MKIVSVEPLFIDRFLYVRIRTDNGIEGYGESGAWGHLEASATSINKFADYLIGRDASQIEHHWNVMQRAGHFSGAAINGAISAIDIALWDIKGKSLNVPIYELLGGAVRDTARLYAHVKGSTIDKLVAEAVAMKDRGFTAIGHLNPMLDEDTTQPYFKTHALKMDQIITNVRLLREAVGLGVDLCVEIHRRLTVPEAIVVGRGIEPYYPMFLEDPVPPTNGDAMAWVADHVPVPIATGERFVSVYQFQALLARRGVEYLRPCICLCGGITAGKKIAALAEAFDTKIVPHNPLSPLSLAACLQLDAAIPNFAIQEYPVAFAEQEGYSDLRGFSLFTGLPEAEAGFIRIPDGPGLGITLVPGAEKTHPVKPRPIQMRPHFDGSMVEQ
jgi:galactonate dehydratase